MQAMMAKIVRNTILQGVNGRIGELVFRQMPDYSTRVSRKPDSRNQLFSQGQVDHQDRFRQAVAYARQASKTQPIYTELARGTSGTPYNLVLSNWFNHPEILEVDTTDWHGAAGHVIRLRVQDDVKVDQVTVTINNGSGDELENGLAVDKGALWWEYETTRAASGSLTLAIAARDLPGHVTENSQKRTFS